MRQQSERSAAGQGGRTAMPYATRPQAPLVSRVGLLGKKMQAGIFVAHYPARAWFPWRHTAVRLST